MRCYFMRDGHIAGVELLSDVSDTAAIAEALVLFKERQDKYVAFEIWDRARFVYRFPVDDKRNDRSKPAA
ncbi:MAG: hypothetical protein ACREE3_12330 [Stellaceae bacterium]